MGERVIKKVPIVITTGKKKFYSSVWRVQDCYYDRKKKSSSRLSGGCAIAIMTGKKNLVVCLAGVRSLLRPKKKKVLVVFLAGARSLLRLEKESSSHLSGG